MICSRATRTSEKFHYDNNSELLMPATINNVPRKLEAFRKRPTEILRKPTDSTVTGFCKGRQGAGGRVERKMVFRNCEGVCR
jgi:hypothetical protein